MSELASILLQVVRDIAHIQIYGAIVLHDVDARFPIAVAHRGPFDRVIFNFPHAGSGASAAEHSALLRDFFRGCQCVSSRGRSG